MFLVKKEILKIFYFFISFIRFCVLKCLWLLLLAFKLILYWYRLYSLVFFGLKLSFAFLFFYFFWRWRYGQGSFFVNIFTLDLFQCILVWNLVRLLQKWSFFNREHWWIDAIYRWGNTEIRIFIIIHFYDF